MPIYKRKGSEVWYLDVNIPGYPRVRRSTGTDDRSKALAVEAKVKHELFSRPVLRGKTWGNAVILWTKRATRSDSDIYSLRKFAKYFPDRMIEEVTREDVDAALAFCKTPGTYMRYRTIVAAVLNLAKDEGWLTAVPKLATRQGKKTTRAWITPAQWTKLYLALPVHLRAPADFALQTGLRQANVLGLTWDRVDLERRMVWVEAEDTKAENAIAIPLSDRAYEILDTLQDTDPTFVFTYRGKPFKKAKTAFQAACVRAGLGRLVVGADGVARYQGFTWHGLRHTWATWHVQNGTPLDVLQKLGSWSDLRMVMNYAHHHPGHLAKYANNATRKEPT
jgi:integrase